MRLWDKSTQALDIEGTASATPDTAILLLVHHLNSCRLAYVTGGREIHRFCVVIHDVCDVFPESEILPHAIAEHDTMEEAKKCALTNIPANPSPESPVVIIDLDTGEEWECDFTAIQWRAVRRD